MSPRARRVAAAALATAAVALFALGGLALYATVNIFSSERFADRAVSVLRHDDARRFAADRVTDGIVRAAPDLTGARPLIAAAADAIAGSGAFQTLFRGAVVDLHRTFFRREKDSVVLGLADAAILVEDALRVAAPRIAEKIPADVEPRLASITEAETGVLADAAQIAEDVRLLGILGLVASIGLAVAACWLSSDRRRMAQRLAVAVAVVGVTGAVLFEVGRLVVGGLLPDAAAARAVWDAFLGDLLTWSLVAAASGAIVAAAAASLLRPVPAEVLVRGVAERLGRKPETTRGRAIRAGVLAAGGAVLVLSPVVALRVVTVVVGCLLIYAAVAEVLALALPPLAPEREPSARRAARLPRRLPRWGVALVVSLLLVGGTVAVASLADTPEEPPVDLSSCNGSPRLCERTVDQVAFPSTHNSMSSVDRPGWLFAQHEAGIPDQLEAGIRGLLIDFHYGVRTPRGVATVFEADSPSRDKIEAPLGRRFLETAERLRSRIGFRTADGARDVYLCHGFCEVGAVRAAPVLRQIREFLVTHPADVIVLSIESDVEVKAAVRVLEESGLAEMAWNEPIRPGRVPTLRQMIDADRRVLVMVWQRGEPGATPIGNYPWLHPQFDLTQETPYEFKTQRELLDSSSCRPNEGRPENPLFLLNHWVDTSPYFRPSNARKVNAYEMLLRRAEACARMRRRKPNLVAVDFFREGDVVRVARALNER